MLFTVAIFILSVILLLPLLPPHFVFGTDYYYNNKNQKVNRSKVSILHFFLHQVLALFQELILGFAVPLSLKGAVTILIFVVVSADLYFKRGLSSQGFAISVIGVIALYLDQLVTNASELDFFKIFRYKSK